MKNTIVIDNHELEDACKRGILELIIQTLRITHHNKITITYPIGACDPPGHFILDYTKAYISVKNNQNIPYFTLIIQLHFDNMPSTLTIFESMKTSYKSTNLSLIDPNCHFIAIDQISKSIDQVTKVN